MVEYHNYRNFQLSNIVALAAYRYLIPLAEFDPDPGNFDLLVPRDPMLVTQLYQTTS